MVILDANLFVYTACMITLPCLHMCALWVVSTHWVLASRLVIVMGTCQYAGNVSHPVLMFTVVDCKLTYVALSMLQAQNMRSANRGTDTELMCSYTRISMVYKYRETSFS